MNLLDTIPGDRISWEQFKIISSEIFSALNPENIPQLDRFYQMKIKSKQDIMNFLQEMGWI